MRLSGYWCKQCETVRILMWTEWDCQDIDVNSQEIDVNSVWVSEYLSRLSLYRILSGLDVETVWILNWSVKTIGILCHQWSYSQDIDVKRQNNNLFITKLPQKRTFFVSYSRASCNMSIELYSRQNLFRYVSEWNPKAHAHTKVRQNSGAFIEQVNMQVQHWKGAGLIILCW